MEVKRIFYKTKIVCTAVNKMSEGLSYFECPHQKQVDIELVTYFIGRYN